METKKVGELDKEAVAELKKKHKKVLCFCQKDSEGTEHYSYLRKPTIDDADFARSAAGDSDGITFGKKVIEKCWLGGSDAVKVDADLVIGMVQAVTPHLKPIAAKAVKL